MPKQVKFRRGTTAQHATFTGALGEVSVDTTKKTLVCHDGATAGGFPVALETNVSVRVGNMLWVDAVNGNDSTGTRGKAYLPFLSCGAAKAAASSGDTILVLPGTYNEKNLAKNGVNWFFFPGAVVAFNGTGTGGIFDTATAGVTCSFTVSGSGVFKIVAESGASAVINLNFTTDVITVRCESISGLGACASSQGSLNLFAVSCSSASYACIEFFGTGTNQIRVEKISSSGGNAINCAGGTSEIVAYRISSTAGKGIRFTSGTLNVTAFEISSSTDYGIEYNNTYSNVFTVVGARVVSTLASASGKAAFVTAGTTGLRLVRCSLVSSASATISIDAAVATTVLLYGETVANLAKGANVTATGSALTVNASLV